MDETPLYFVLVDCKSYADTGSKEVWCASATSGLEKSQCAVQLTIFFDGILLVCPIHILRGQGNRIYNNEQDSWDQPGHVALQKKKCFFEPMLKKSINEQWANLFINPAAPGLTGKILVFDADQAQRTDDVKALVEKKKAELVNVPSGGTSQVQPLDVVLISSFKKQYDSSLRSIWIRIYRNTPTESLLF